MTATDYLSSVAACFDTVEATGADGALSLNDGMVRGVERLRLMQARGGEVHLVGNGGSAAIVAHAQNDFIKAAEIRARVYQDHALQTAYANDVDYASSLSIPLWLLMRETDVLIAVSSSGESQNILKAVESAKQKQATTITLSGFQPMNRLRALGDLNFYVPSMDYGHVELTHAVLLHHLTDAVAHA